ncbi:MAG: hypothetical protein J0L80_12160 [Chitinophagales bacterium]|nr:hypothetical protein [Chitinophagales bacterium]
MSAFYDIWIGNEPKYTRLDNTAWQVDKTMPQLWNSLPGNSEYYTAYEDESASIILIGQLYESVDIASLMKQCAQYISGDASVFDEPAGHYALIVYIKASKQYHVFTNRLGTYHLYYSSIEGVNTVSTYYTGLAKNSSVKTLDWEGITGFMAMGFFPGNTTWLEGIAILEPASHYTFSEDLDLLSYKRYWNWSFSPAVENEDNLLERFDGILQEIMSFATANKKVALPISGGLDSRTLAGVLAKQIKQPKSVWSYSYGYTAKSIETKIAKKIAKAEGIAFDEYVVPQYLFEKSATIADAVELFQYIDGTRQACMLDELEQRADVVVGGHWGDVWMDDMGMGTLNENEFFKKKIVKRGSDWLLENVCKPHYANYDTFLKNYFYNWNNQHSHIEDKDFRMKIFKTDQWSFRWTVPSLRMYQAAVLPVLPFYDKRIVDFFSMVPTSIVQQRLFQIAYIKKHHPELARIKWQEYDANLHNYKRFNNRNLLYRIVKRIQRSLKTNNNISRNWELFYLNDAGRKNLEKILLDNPAFAKIVEIEKVKELLQDFYDYPTAANGYRISMMHTFAVFMKTVFND